MKTTFASLYFIVLKRVNKKVARDVWWTKIKMKFFGFTWIGLFIPCTGYIKFSTKLVTPRRKRRSKYIYKWSVDLAMFVGPSVCLYICELSALSFKNIALKFYTRLSLPKKLIIWRNRQYRTTIAYKLNDRNQVLMWKTITYLHEIRHVLIFKAMVQSPRNCLESFVFVKGIFSCFLLNLLMLNFELFFLRHNDQIT